MISDEQVLEALKVVVAGREDYRYIDDHSECRYADEKTGKPSCIAGHAVKRLTIDGFKYLRDVEIDMGSWMISAYREEEVSISMQGLLVLRTAQAVQDGGGTWGEALSAAENFFSATHEDKEEE